MIARSSHGLFADSVIGAGMVGVGRGRERADADAGAGGEVEGCDCNRGA